MEILIQEDFYVSGSARFGNDDTKAVHAWFEANKGKWITVDVSSLQENSYKTIDGVWVNDNNVQAVRDDARIGKGRCSGCGKVHTIGESKCSEWKEGTIEGVTPSSCHGATIKPFTESNVYFIEHPNGLPRVKPLPKTKENERFTNNEFKCGSFSLEQLGGLNRFRLKNARQTFIFLWDSKNQTYWTGDFSKVYTPRTSLCRGHNRISASSFKEEELKAYLDTQTIN